LLIHFLNIVHKCFQIKRSGKRINSFPVNGYAEQINVTSALMRYQLTKRTFEPVAYILNLQQTGNLGSHCCGLLLKQRGYSLFDR
jgi:hypothetical protein